MKHACLVTVQLFVLLLIVTGCLAVSALAVAGVVVLALPVAAVRKVGKAPG
jgi:hypothetical protein